MELEVTFGLDLTLTGVVAECGKITCGVEKFKVSFRGIDITEKLTENERIGLEIRFIEEFTREYPGWRRAK